METSDAYIAGVMDSEGSFSITWNKHQATTAGVVAIANTNLKLLEFVMQRFGGAVYLQSRTHMGARTPCYQWLCSSTTIDKFIKAIRPYMICKGEQADVMLEHHALRMHRLTPEARQRRLELRTKMLELNQTKLRNQHYVELTGEERPTGAYNWHRVIPLTAERPEPGPQQS